MPALFRPAAGVAPVEAAQPLADRLGQRRPARTGTPWPAPTGTARRPAPEYGERPTRAAATRPRVRGRSRPRPASPATSDVARLLALRPVRADHARPPRGCAGGGGSRAGRSRRRRARRPGSTAVGSSSRISSANDSALPLCGVAEARISASVLRGEQPRQPVVLGAELVRLCDSSMTTASQRCLLQVRRVAVALQRVDRDDHPLVVGERVAGGRQLLPDPLDAGRVQPHERQREPRPHLVLHLLQHVPRA